MKICQCRKNVWNEYNAFCFAVFDFSDKCSLYSGMMREAWYLGKLLNEDCIKLFDVIYQE